MTQMYITSAQKLEHYQHPLPRAQTAIGSLENPIRQELSQIEQTIAVNPLAAQQYAEAQRRIYLQAVQEDIINQIGANKKQHQYGIYAYGLIDLYA